MSINYDKKLRNCIIKLARPFIAKKFKERRNKALKTTMRLTNLTKSERMKLAYTEKYLKGINKEEVIPSYHPNFTFEEQCEEIKLCLEYLGYEDEFMAWYQEAINAVMPDWNASLNPDQSSQETTQIISEEDLIQIRNQYSSTRLKRELDMSVFENKASAKLRKAYSYIRMSTETQLKGDSLRRQLEASEKFALENDLQLVDSIDGVTLKDIGVSAYRGTNSKDGVLAKFLEHLEQGKIEANSVLLIESLDRLSRAQVLDALSQFLNIVSYDIEVITLTDRQRYTKQSLNENPGQLMISLGVMFRANEESATKSKRIRESWVNKRNRATEKPLTSIGPAWLTYSHIENKFEVVEERAKVIHTIFELCAHVCGQGAIAKYLNQHQIPTFGKGQFWQQSYIKKIIPNRAVLGEYQPHSMIDGKRQPIGEPIQNYFPRVIDDELFNLANAAINRRTVNSSGRKGASFSNLFSGLMYCGNCGTKIVFRNRGSGPKGGQSLTCHQAMSKANCNAPEWKYSSVENLLLRHLREINFGELLGNKTSGVEFEHQLLALQNQLKDKQQGFNKLIDLVESDQLHDEAKNRILDRLNKASSELAELTRQVEAKKHQLDDHNSQLKVFSEDVLKQALELIAEKKEDYFFRSSVNQLLARAIARIDLIVEDQTYHPYEIDEDDGIVRSFRKLNPELQKLSHEKLLERNDFKTYWLQHEKRIRISYKTGEVRQLLVGYDVSFEPAPLKKQYRDTETGHFITEEEIKDRDINTFKAVLVRQPIPKRTIR